MTLLRGHCYAGTVTRALLRGHCYAPPLRLKFRGVVSGMNPADVTQRRVWLVTPICEIC